MQMFIINALTSKKKVSLCETDNLQIKHNNLQASFATKDKQSIGYKRSERAGADKLH